MLERSLEAINNFLVQFDDARIWLHKFGEVEGVKRGTRVRVAITKGSRLLLAGDGCKGCNQS